jgi:cytochrome c oxidase cbb3-type subunit 4
MTSGIITVIAFASFLGLVAWAWSRRNRARFESASRLPLEDETPPCCKGQGGQR